MQDNVFYTVSQFRADVPLLMLITCPQDKKALGTRHPLFAPNYVSPLVAATPERRENRVLKQEAAAMLTAADIKRR